MSFLRVPLIRQLKNIGEAKIAEGMSKEHEELEGLMNAI